MFVGSGLKCPPIFLSRIAHSPYLNPVFACIQHRHQLSIFKSFAGKARRAEINFNIAASLTFWNFMKDRLCLFFYQDEKMQSEGRRKTQMPMAIAWSLSATEAWWLCFFIDNVDTEKFVQVCVCTYLGPANREESQTRLSQQHPNNRARAWIFHVH